MQDKENSGMNMKGHNFLDEAATRTKCEEQGAAARHYEAGTEKKKAFF